MHDLFVKWLPFAILFTAITGEVVAQPLQGKVEVNNVAPGGGEFFASSSVPACGTPNRPVDMERMLEIAQKYPYPEVLFLTAEQHQELLDSIARWNSPRDPNTGEPLNDPWLGLDPGTGCNDQVTMYILYKKYYRKRDPQAPRRFHDDYYSGGLSRPADDKYDSDTPQKENASNTPPDETPDDGKDRPSQPIRPLRDKEPDPERNPCAKNICTLLCLAQMIFDRYETDYPIATVKLQTNHPRTDPNVYLVLLQGVELTKLSNLHQHTHVDDAMAAWLGVAAAHKDGYRQAILKAIDCLPKDAQLIIAGHSLGGIEAQNLVYDPGINLTKGSQRRVVRVFAFGAPVRGVLDHKVNYLFVKDTRDMIAGLDLEGLFRSANILQISPDGVSSNLFDQETGAHFIYNKELSGLGEYNLNGEKSSEYPFCFVPDYSTWRTFEAPRANGHQSPEEFYGLDCCGSKIVNATVVGQTRYQPSYDWSTLWKTGTEQAKISISEQLGELAMDEAAQQLGYTVVLSIDDAHHFKQGFDAVYMDRDGTYVVAESKGGYNGETPDNKLLKEGYGCRQGTMGWVFRACKRILRPTKGNPRKAEDEAAILLMKAIQDRKPIRVELFHTEHNEGVPGVTRRYIIDQYP